MVKNCLLIVFCFNIIYTKPTIGEEEGDNDNDQNELATTSPLSNGTLPDISEIETTVSQAGDTQFFNLQYFFDVESYDFNIEHRLKKAMLHIEQFSCVRFERVLMEKRDFNKTLIRVSNPRKQRECCHDPIVRKEDNIVELVLGLDCLQQREILHSLLHALGFHDEVTHPDRDKYVRILWDNIHPKYRNLYRIKTNENFASHHIEYDPYSVMQFNRWEFSNNGRPTAVAVLPVAWNRKNDKLTANDLIKLRILFGSACTHRKLTELMDSCKEIIAGDEKKEDGENNGPGFENVSHGDEGELTIDFGD